jgi:predicted lipoprotein
LRALIEQVVVPTTANVAATSRRLDGALARLAGEPSLTTLRQAREQWQHTLLSWKRADAFHQGPIMDANCLLRAMFWPVRTAGIDELLQGSQAIDDASINVMGVDRRGLFALEYLLYSADEADERIVLGFTGSAGERRARLARSLAGNISDCADSTARALGDGKAYASKFADGGQESLNRLALHLVSTVENLCVDRLARISSLAKNGQLARAEVEGGGSRMSLQIALAHLRAAEELYRGVDRGLSELVKAQSPAVDESLRAAFAQALGAVSKLGLPLEEVAKRDLAALDAAVVVLKKLEHALKSELLSTLGVSASFSSVDGD